MNPAHIGLLYRRELRAALRERSVVINSLLLPVLLYPLLLWGMFSAMSFVAGQAERFVSRVAIEGLDDEHAALRESLEEHERVEVLPVPVDPRAAVEDGELDAFVEVVPAAGDAALLDGNFLVRIVHDASEDRSTSARDRVARAVAEYRAEWVEREAEAGGVDLAAWDVFRVEGRDVASSDERGAFVLGMLAPMLMVIMVALGCFYPAVDAVAGERERQTWETSMTLATSRSSVVVAKFLYVATLGTASGLLNLTGLAVSMGAILEPLLGDQADALVFRFPWEALPIVVLGTALLALFIAAGMMLLASFARTFKEGQSMVSPFYLLVILPPLLVQSPDLELTPTLALAPVANVVLLFREAIGGHVDWALAGLVLVVEVVTVGLLLAAARWVLGFEEVLTGSHDGSLLKFVQAKLGGAK